MSTLPSSPATHYVLKIDRTTTSPTSLQKRMAIKNSKIYEYLLVQAKYKFKIYIFQEVYPDQMYRLPNLYLSGIF